MPSQRPQGAYLISIGISDTGVSMRRLHHDDRHKRINRRLYRQGVYQPQGPHRGSADFSGKGANQCERPLYRTISSFIKRPMAFEAEKYWSDGQWKVRPAAGEFDLRHRHTDLTIRCRKCPACLRARGILWRIRAIEEIALSKRTWFCTFTLAPESHSAILNRVLLDAARSGNPRLEQDISPEEMFLERNKVISTEFTKYFKRLRKMGYKFRYLLVVEAHKSGLPHYHALIHDCSITKPLVWRAISNQWKLGFSQAKLVPDDDIRCVYYVTKYLMKSAISRVRASAGYGQAAPQGAQSNDWLSREGKGKLDPPPTTERVAGETEMEQAK